MIVLVKITDSIWINPVHIVSVCIAPSGNKICIKTIREEFLVDTIYRLTAYQSLDRIIELINKEQK